MISLKRVYDPAAKTDGIRILVDRLWPRGLTKERAKVDVWLKDVAPSDDLRKWFAHDPAKWEEFKERYAQELKSKGEILKVVESEMQKGTVTLVFSAKDEKYNNAVVLKEHLHANK